MDDPLPVPAAPGLSDCQSVGTFCGAYEALNEKYQAIKKKAQPYLDALEIASERVRAFLSAILARGKEHELHNRPDKQHRQDMEV